jgi:uncharacterized glyoxalase superfamily protein PhnB
LFITCDTEEEINLLYDNLSEGGEVLMPLDDYSFSKKIGWVTDKFSVSWQLNSPKLNGEKAWIHFPCF